MYQLSSGATLLLRLFLPTVWTVFFGSFMVMGWFWEDNFIGPFPITGYRWVSTAFVGTGLLMIRLTVWRLRRVDADSDHLFVSDYFRTFRYTRPGVQGISLYPAGPLVLAKITLVAPGRMGRQIWFLPAKRRLKAFHGENPEWSVTQD